MASSTPKELGAIISESAANPTLLRQRTEEIEPLTNPEIVHTAKGHVRTDKQYPEKIQTRHQARIDIDQYVLTGLDNMHLEVTDIIKSQGLIVLTKKGVYPISEKFMHIVKLGKPISSYQNGVYSTTTRIHDRHTNTEDIDTKQNWQKQANAARIPSRRRSQKKEVPPRPKTTAETTREATWGAITDVSVLTIERSSPKSQYNMYH